MRQPPSVFFGASHHVVDAVQDSKFLRVSFEEIFVAHHHDQVRRSPSASPPDLCHLMQGREATFVQTLSA
jgi:hypothetical protein